MVNRGLKLAIARILKPERRNGEEECRKERMDGLPVPDPDLDAVRVPSLSDRIRVAQWLRSTSAY